MLVKTCRCVTEGCFATGDGTEAGDRRVVFGCTALSAGTRGVGATADGINKNISMGIRHQAATVTRSGRAEAFVDM